MGQVRDLDQLTQEIRLASNGDDRLKWQVGALYFDCARYDRLLPARLFPQAGDDRLQPQQLGAPEQPQHLVGGVRPGQLQADRRPDDHRRPARHLRRQEDPAGEDGRHRRRRPSPMPAVAMCACRTTQVSWDLSAQLRGQSRPERLRPRGQGLPRPDHPGPLGGVQQRLHHRQFGNDPVVGSRLQEYAAGQHPAPERLGLHLRGQGHPAERQRLQRQRRAVQRRQGQGLRPGSRGRVAPRSPT